MEEKFYDNINDDINGEYKDEDNEVDNDNQEIYEINDDTETDELENNKYIKLNRENNSSTPNEFESMEDDQFNFKILIIIILIILFIRAGFTKSGLIKNRLNIGFLAPKGIENIQNKQNNYNNKTIKTEINTVKEYKNQNMETILTKDNIGNICDFRSNGHEVFCYNRKITKIEKGTFDNLKNITILNLNSTNFNQLYEGIFDQLTGLKELYLSNNGIRELPDGIFDNLTELEILYLSTNKLTKLPDGIFDNLTNLKSLNLYNNNIINYPEGIFDNLTSLECLNLNDNSCKISIEKEREIQKEKNLYN